MVMDELLRWQQEITARSGARIAAIPVNTSADGNLLTIPPAFPGREFVRSLLADPGFVAQLIRADALTVNWQQPAGSAPSFHFILLHMARAAEWPEGQPDAVLAHELGHIWLHAEGYRSLPYTQELGCAATHAGDIVQHQLIRPELRRRDLSAYDALWTQRQDRWLAAPQPDPTALDRCARMQLLSACCDALLGYTDEEWPGRAAWLTTVRRLYGSIAAMADSLRDAFSGRDLSDRSIYEWALARSLAACLAVGALE
jgi:hypothetical protein